jgi:hypothetical protein
MIEKHTHPVQSAYMVVYRASTSARFLIEEPPLRYLDYPGAFGPLSVVIRTNYANKAFDVQVPLGLTIDVCGPAPSLDDAMRRFQNAANSLLPELALSANAHIAPVDTVLAYDKTVGVAEREFFQNLSSFNYEMRNGRKIPTSAAIALIQVLNSHPNAGRFRRAISQYNIALSHWRPGNEVLSLAHLFMGVEAITPVARERFCKQNNLADKELSDYWKVAARDVNAEV